MHQRMGLDWNRVRSLLATADHGTLSAAHKALGLAPPAVGRQIAALEDELFERVCAGRRPEPDRPRRRRPLGGARARHLRMLGQLVVRLRRPRNPVQATNFASVVVEIGAEVTVEPLDALFGYRHRGPGLAATTRQPRRYFMDDSNTGERVQQEHAHLRGLIKAIREANEPDVRPLVIELARMLAAHFGAEEAETGWMGEATLAAPHHADVIDELMAEHGAMLAAANGIAAGHGSAESLEVLLKTIEEHERREASVITSVWYEDLGLGD